MKCICNAINFVPSPQQLTQSMQIPNPKFNMSMSNVNSMNRSQSMVQSETFYQRISETNQSHYIQDQLIRSNSVTSQNFSQGNMNYLYPNLNPSFSVNQNQKAQQTNSKTLTNYENLSDLNKDYSTQNFPKSNKDLHFEERMNMKIEKSEYNQDFLPLKQVVNRDLKDESQTEIKISNLPDSLAESKFIPLNTDQNYNKKEIILLNPFQNGYRGLNQNLAESQFIENNNQDAFRKYNNQQAVNKPIWNSNQPMFFGPNHGYVETKLNLKAEKLDDD